MKTKTILAALATVIALTTVRAADITSAEARAIVKEAYIYGFPLVDNYRIQYSYFVVPENHEYIPRWNHIHNVPRGYTTADQAIQTTNSDTSYHFVRTVL